MQDLNLRITTKVVSRGYWKGCTQEVVFSCKKFKNIPPSSTKTEVRE